MKFELQELSCLHGLVTNNKNTNSQIYINNNKAPPGKRREHWLQKNITEDQNRLYY